MRLNSLILAVALLGACSPAAETPAAVRPPAPAPPPPPAAPAKKPAQPVLFNTPEADAILSTLQVFPKDNPWNEDISQRPIHPDSDKIIDQIGRTERFRWNHDTSFI